MGPAAGLRTVAALVLSRRAIGTFIPLFYGSSFSYIASYLGIAQAMGHKVEFGVPAPDNVIAVLQTGIVATGILNIIIGFVIKWAGKPAVDRVLPPVVTGSVACMICILLAFAGKLSAFVGTIPVFVSGGLAIYLFGVIGMQGIALMQEHKINMFEPLRSPWRSWHRPCRRGRRRRRVRGA